MSWLVSWLQQHFWTYARQQNAEQSVKATQGTPSLLHLRNILGACVGEEVNPCTQVHS